MPALEDEPLTLAQAAKKHFQKEEPPREVTHEKTDTVPPKQEKTPEVLPPAAKVDVVPVKEKEQPTPTSEEDAVFGTPSAKTEVEAPKDADFDIELAEEKKGMTEKAGAKWEQLRRSEKAAKEDAKRAREELKTAAESRQEQKVDEIAPKLEEANTKIAALELQLAEAEKTLSITQVERSQKFRREVGEPMSELTKSAEEIALRYDVPSKTILDALKEDPKTRSAKLTELAADFNEPDRIELYGIAKEMDRLNRKGDTLRERAKVDLSALEQEDKEAQERTTAEMRQTFTVSANRAWDESAKTLDFLRNNPAAPEWTAALTASRQRASSYVPGQDAIADGRLASEAAQLPFVVKALEHHKTKLATITEERDRLLERVKADGEHDPSLGGAHEEHDDIDSGGEEMTLGQRAKLAAGKMTR